MGGEPMEPEYSFKPTPWMPGSPEVEKHVLGAVLVNPEEGAIALERLKPADFCWQRHSLLFETMQELYAAGKAITALTMVECLTKAERLDGSGGRDYLLEIMSEVVSAANVEAHVQLVKEASRRRRLIVGMGNVLEIARDQRKENQEVQGEAENLILSLAEDQFSQGLTHIDTIKIEALKDMADAALGKVTGVQTGLKDLDAMTGGFQPTDLIILAGRPGMGKTALGLTIAWRSAFFHKKRVAFFSLEMGRKQLVQRILCAPKNVNLHALRTGRVSHEEMANFTEASTQLQGIPLYIDDASKKTPIQLFSQLRRMRRTWGLDMVIFDYAQLCRLDKPPENRAQELGQCAYAMKAIAKDLEIPFVLLAQLNREVEHHVSKRPQLSNLKESGGLEEAADIVGGLFRPEVYEKGKAEAGRAELDWLKFRNGPAGETTLFRFNKESASFSDYIEPTLLEGPDYERATRPTYHRPKAPAHHGFDHIEPPLPRYRGANDPRNQGDGWYG